MVLALVRPAIIVAQQVWKHRKAIYAVITAQDRYIKSATTYGRWSKSASYGWRSGAIVGSFAGAFITNAEDSPGNGIQTPIRPKSPSSKPYQTRSRFTKRDNSRYRNQCKPYNKYRYSNTRRY